MSAVSQSKARAIAEDARLHCHYCGRPTARATGSIDHYMPLALGGTNARQNLRWACKPCNRRKADLHPDAWRLIAPAKWIDPTPRETPGEYLSRILQERSRVGRQKSAPRMGDEVELGERDADPR